MVNIEKKYKGINFTLIIIFILLTMTLFQNFSPKTNFTPEKAPKGSISTHYVRDSTIDKFSQFNLNKSSLNQSLDKNTPFSGFVENRGQLSDSSISLYFWGFTSFIGFSNGKIYFIQKTKNKTTAFFINFEGANNVDPTGIEKLNFSSNFFLGNTHNIGVNNYKEVWYYNIYPKIDLRYYISEGRLKYEFIVRPGGNLSNINIQISDSVHLNVSPESISLRSLDNKSIILSDSNLHVFQGNNFILNSKFIQLSPNEYSFSISNYNKNIPLIIDPLWLQFSTYLGGAGLDASNSVKIDNSGNIYVMGYTSYDNFNISSNFFTSNNQDDIFVMKLDSTGTQILYSTFIGGNSEDKPRDFSLDNSNDVIISGTTNSTNFPTLHAYNSTPVGGGLFDGFITGLNKAGNGLLFSSYFDEGGNTSINKIVLDNTNNIYITGSFTYVTIPPLNTSIFNFIFHSDVFVAKFNFNLNLIFNNLFKNSEASSWGIALNSVNDIYISGSTSSATFPTVNAYDTTLNGTVDAFLMEFTSNGTPFFSTYLGGNNIDESFGLAVNSHNYVIVAGQTLSSDFPTVNSISASNKGERDIFVSIFDQNHNLIDSTYLGGSSNDTLSNLALDTTDNVFITGSTESSNFPMVNGVDTTWNGNRDAYVVKLSPDISSILFSTYLGGNQFDTGMGIASYQNNIYVSGFTISNDFPQVNSLQISSGTSQDAFLTIYGFDNTPPMLINDPLNQNIKFGSLGNTLSWHATDTNPNLYYIYQNSILVDSNSWKSNVPITVNIDNLNVGSYNYSILVTDKAGLTASNSVLVTVSGTANSNSVPAISSPTNKQSKEFFGNLIISWIGIDSNPSSFKIYENGNGVEAGFWQSGAPINYKENWYYKAPGRYNITLEVDNNNGNFATNTVFVSVIVNPTIQQSLKILEPIIAALLVINFVAIGYEVIRKDRDFDPESPPDDPTGISIASNNDYMFISWIGCDTHPIIQWLLDKKIAILLIILMRIFWIDTKNHLFIAVASESKKDFPNSDSWVYKKKIKHSKSNFRPSIISFENKLYIAFTSKNNKIQLKALNLEENNWKLEDVALPKIDSKLLNSSTEPVLSKEYEVSQSKYVRLFLSFYSITSKSIIIFYLENGIWILSSKKIDIEKFDGFLSSTILLSEQNNDLSYSWVSNKKINTELANKKLILSKSLPSSLGGAQLNYITEQDNVIEHGTFFVYDKSVRLDKFNSNQLNWENVEWLKKKTRYPPSITQFKNEIYIVWIKKHTPFYFKEYFLATIINNLARRDVIEYEPVEFEKIIPTGLDILYSKRNENDLTDEIHSDYNDVDPDVDNHYSS